MSHETPTISATLRERTGTRYAQRLRQTGRLPAVIYGHKSNPVSISVDALEVIDFLQQGAHLFSIDVDGNSTETCLVKDLQFGYLGDDVIHLDFARVDLDEEVTVNVRLTFAGEPAAVKKPGAILNHDITDLEVICKANNIPGAIRVELGDMEEVFTVGEIKMPEGVRTDIAPDTVVARISIILEEEAEGEEVEVAAGDEPQVITEAQPEDGAAKPEKGDEKKP